MAHRRRYALHRTVLRAALALGAVRMPPLLPRAGVFVPPLVRDTLRWLLPGPVAPGQLPERGELAEALEASPP